MRAAKRAAGLAPRVLAYTLAAWGVGPNILLMMADDLGWNAVGFNGSAIEPPAIDSLAAPVAQCPQCPDGAAADLCQTAPLAEGRHVQPGDGSVGRTALRLQSSPAKNDLSAAP